MTPFLAQPGTQLMVEAFETAAKAKSWEVNVIDTSGDVAALVSRMEDVSLQKVDAIVINVDPSQIKTGLLAAKDAGIPVFGMDSGNDPLLKANITKASLGNLKLKVNKYYIILINSYIQYKVLLI